LCRLGQLAFAFGELVAVLMRVFLQQAMVSKESYGPGRNTGKLLVGFTAILRKQPEVASQVSIGDTRQLPFRTGDNANEIQVLGHGLKATHFAPVDRLAAHCTADDVIEGTPLIRVDLERVQNSFVDAVAGLGPLAQVLDALAQRSCSRDGFWPHGPQGFEGSWIVDGGFNSQVVELVVDLDRIATQPVAHAQAIGEAQQAAGYFGSGIRSQEAIGIGTTVEIAHDSIGSSIGQCLEHNTFRLAIQAIYICENEIGGPLALPAIPGIIHFGTDYLLLAGEDKRNEATHIAAPIGLINLLLQQGLCCDVIITADDLVVASLVWNACLDQAPSQPLAAIDRYLDHEWQPGLQSNAHEAKDWMFQVEVEMFAAGSCWHQHWPSCGWSDLEGGAFLDTGPGSDGTLMQAMFPLVSRTAPMNWGQRAGPRSA
jgi:hypothetical protein